MGWNLKEFQKELPFWYVFIISCMLLGTISSLLDFHLAVTAIIGVLHGYTIAKYKKRINDYFNKK